MTQSTVIVRLNKTVPGLGQSGQLARVSFGYARNALLPTGSAKMMTGRRAALQLDRQRQVRSNPPPKHQPVQAIADSLAGRSVSLVSAANADGKLFASVQADDVATALKTDPIFRMQPIKQTGTHQVSLDFGHDITVVVTVTIIGQSMARKS